MVAALSWEQSAVEALLAQALARLPFGEGEAVFTAQDAALTRFANSQIHQNVSEHDATLRLRIIHEGRTGVATTNRLDAEGLTELVERTAEICRRTRPHPDAAVLADPTAAVVPDGLGYFADTAEADPRQRAEGARAVIAAGDAVGLEVSGAFSSDTSILAVANSRGLSNSHRATSAKLLTVMLDGRGGSGYAQATSPDISRIDAAAVGAEASERAVRGADAVDLEPGEYPVILGEYAVGTILEYLAYIAFSGLAVEEGRSLMRLGEPVMGSNVSIWDDGLDPNGMPTAIDYEGVPKQRVDLVVNGVASAVVHDSATARRAGMDSTGHGLPAPNVFGPLSWNLFMAPGGSSPADMLKDVERGIWVTRFHYVNIVHAKRGILTGMTKDGTFLIEDGEITRPIRNLRFTQSIPEAFSRISEIGSDTRLVAAEYGGIYARVPALKIDGFTFTGATSQEATG